MSRLEFKKLCLRMSGLQLKTAPLFITKYELSNRRPAERLTYELSLFYQSDFQLLSSSFL